MATRYIVIMTYRDVQGGKSVKTFGSYPDIWAAKKAEERLREIIRSEIASAETDGFRISSRNRPSTAISVIDSPITLDLEGEVREIMRFLPYTRKG